MKKTKSEILLFLALLISGSLTLWLALSFYTSAANFFDAEIFSSTSKKLFEFLTILFFIIIIFGGKLSISSNSPINFPFQYIWKALLGTLVFFIGTIILVNPRGLYGFTLFPQLSTNIRGAQVSHFVQQEESPEIVILGSSRALTFSPRYISEQTGLHTFNFSVANTRLDEYLILTHLLLSNQFQDAPSVILLEFPLTFWSQPEFISVNAPIEYLQFMSYEMQRLALTTRVEEIFNIHQFSESAYVIQYSLQRDVPEGYWELQFDGSAIPHPALSLEDAIAEQLEFREDRDPCILHMPEEGREIFNEILQLAEESNISIIFFVPPVHPTFSDNYIRSEICLGDAEVFLEESLPLYENLYIFDFNDPQPFEAITDETGFLDGFHFTELNANLMIDEMLETILEAYQQANSIETIP